MPRPKFKKSVDPGIERPEDFYEWGDVEQAEFIAEAMEIAKTRGATQEDVARVLFTTVDVLKKRLQINKLPQIAKDRIKDGAIATTRALKLFKPTSKITDKDLESLDPELRQVVEEFRGRLT